MDLITIAIALASVSEPMLDPPQAVIHCAHKFATEQNNISVIVVVGGRPTGLSWKSQCLKFNDERLQFLDYTPGPRHGNLFGRLNIFTGSYYAELNKYVKDGPYLLKYLNVFNSKTEYEKAKNTSTDEFLLLPYAIGGQIPFAEVFQRPYSIQSLEEIGAGVDRTVVISLKRENNEYGLQEGKFTFLPEKKWVCIKQENMRFRRAGGEFISHIELSYQTWPCGLFYPSKIVAQTQDVGNPERKPFYTATVESVERDVLTGAEFKLSTYGIPEPGPQAEQSTPFDWRYWLAVGCLFSVGFAILFSVRGKKTAST